MLNLCSNTMNIPTDRGAEKREEVKAANLAARYVVIS